MAATPFQFHPVQGSLPSLLRRAVLPLVAFVAAAGLSACASIFSPDKAPVIDVPVPPSLSTADAERKLKQVNSERAGAEARYASAEQACYRKFFVNNCLDSAKEDRRSTLAVLRAIEIEAARYKRQAVVDERDRAMAEAEREYAASDARQAQAPAAAPAPPAGSQPAARPGKQAGARPGAPASGGAPDRLDAQQRAANAAAFEKRRIAAERRQAEIAARKAQNAAKAAREAEARASAAAAKAKEEAGKAAAGK